MSVMPPPAILIVGYYALLIWIVLSHRPDDDAFETGTVSVSRGWRALGVTAEFGRRDKALYLATWGWNLAWVAVFAVGTIYFMTRDVPDGDWSRWNPGWLRFWEAKIWLELAVGAVVIVWLTWGGVRDVRRLLRDLRERRPDERDDGFVED